MVWIDLPLHDAHVNSYYGSGDVKMHIETKRVTGQIMYFDDVSIRDVERIKDAMLNMRDKDGVNIFAKEK